MAIKLFGRRSTTPGKAQALDLNTVLSSDNGSSHELTSNKNPPPADIASVTSSQQKQEVDLTAEQEAAMTDHPEDDYQYPKGIQLTIITVSLCMAVFLISLDNTIIATAIPRITDHFKRLNDVGWYGSAYLLTTCSFQLMFGKFYKYFSIKWTFLIAILIFEIGSAVCGAAPSSTALILGRAVAGIGSSGIFSGALIIIAHTVPMARRPMYMGFIGGMYGIASVAGPLMGGAFTDHLSWRWCFYINLPFGAVTITGIVLFFKSPSRKAQTDATAREKFAGFDPYGTVVFLPAIISLLLALQWGGSTYAWKDARIIALFVLFGVLITIFIGIQLWQKNNATIPPHIIGQRSMAFASFFALCLGGSFFIMVYYIPIWFQAIKGVTAMKSGIMSIPVVLGVVIASLASGALVTKLGYYWPFMILSSILAGIGTGLLTTFTTHTGHSKWIGYQAIFGLGIGFGMQMPLVLSQTVLKLEDVPVGTSVIMFLQTLGGALFVSVAQNVFSNQLIDGVKKVSPQLAAIVLNVGATELKDYVPKAELPAVQVAYNHALTTTWYICVALSCLTLVGSLGIEWHHSVKGKKVEAVAA